MGLILPWEERRARRARVVERWAFGLLLGALCVGGAARCERPVVAAGVSDLDRRLERIARAEEAQAVALRGIADRCGR